MKIALDAVGGDRGMAPIIEGGIEAARKHGVTVIFAGAEPEIRAQLSKRGISPNDKSFEVMDTRETVGKHEDPSAACRAKPRASIMLCAESVAAGRAQAMVSAGSSGATMAAALWHLKRLPGVLRPALAVLIPTTRGTAVLLDSGANPECKPWHLMQFALMGTLFARHVLEIPDPGVAVLSMGKEDNLGNELVKEAIPLLKSSGLRFLGAVEGRDITAGAADVIVCDGFVGDIAAKVIEGTTTTLIALLKRESLAGLLSRLGGVLLEKALSRLKRRMRYDGGGGASLLGVDGAVLICDGRSNAKAIGNALHAAKELVEKDIAGHIRRSLDELKPDLDTAKVQA